MRVTWMRFSFAVSELRRDTLSMLETHIVMSSLIFCIAFTLMLHLILILMLCLLSLMDLTIAHMVLVHERTDLCLDTLDMTHVLIVVIISHVGLCFSASLAPTLSQEIWTIHIFPIVVHVPLDQMGRCKVLPRLLLVAWLSAGFLRFISLTPVLSHRLFLVLCRCWTEAWRTRGS
jgi:hypothetical protein